MISYCHRPSCAESDYSWSNIRQPHRSRLRHQRRNRSRWSRDCELLARLSRNGLSLQRGIRPRVSAHPSSLKSVLILAVPEPWSAIPHFSPSSWLRCTCSSVLENSLSSPRASIWLTTVLPMALALAWISAATCWAIPSVFTRMP